MKAMENVRIQLRNILYCTDLSDAAERAFPYAANLARHFGSRLHGLYVRRPEHRAWVAPHQAPPLSELPEAQARDRLRNLLAQSAGIETNVLIAEGDLWLSVKAAIENEEIDLIVLGTRGRSGLKKFLLGSAAEEIVRRAPCAVLTVGPHSEERPVKPGEISEILYATDFTPEAAAAAPYAISLAQEYQAHLTLLHVMPPSEPGDLVSFDQMAPAFERRLREIVPPESELWCEPHCIVSQGVAAEEILAVARHRNADLIILGVRRPGGLTTHLPIATAHRVVSQAICPVLTVRG